MARGLSKSQRSASRSLVPGVKRIRSVSSPYHPLYHKLKSGEPLTPEEQIFLERQEIPDIEADAATIVSSDKVMQKYSDSATICSQAIVHLMKLAKEGSVVSALCAAGDEFIDEKCDAIHRRISKKKGITAPRGTAFPTTVSVNQIVANHAPLPQPHAKDEGDHVVIALGDVVRIHVAAHIDGYAAVASHTFVVTSTSHLVEENGLAAAVADGGAAAGDVAASKKVRKGGAAMATDVPAAAPAPVVIHAEGAASLRLANVAAPGGVCEGVARSICAAHACVEAGAAALQPGVSSSVFPRVIRAVCDAYGVEPLEGVLSHRHVQGSIAGEDCMIGRVEYNTEPQQDVAAFKIQAGMVFGIDIAVTTSREHTRLRRGAPPTRIFVRNEVAQPVVKPSTRQLLKYLKVDRRGVPFPFHTRGAKAAAGGYPDMIPNLSGVAELNQHSMLEPFPPLLAHRPNESVARFTATVAVLNTGPRVISVHLPLPDAVSESSSVPPASVDPRRIALQLLPRTATLPSQAAQRRLQAELKDIPEPDTESDDEARGRSVAPGPRKRPRTLSKAERKLVMGALPPAGCGRGASRSRSSYLRRKAQLITPQGPTKKAREASESAVPVDRRAAAAVAPSAKRRRMRSSSKMRATPRG